MPTAPDLDLAVERLDRRFGLDALWLFGSRASGAARRLGERLQGPDGVLWI